MNKPIGIFDSGVGGLTVAKEILKTLPNETIYFYGDVKNCPFGEKNKEDIIKFTEKAVKFLINKGVKMIVLACNTATAASLDYLEEKYDVPIIGVIKAGAKTAIKTTKNNKVIVLGTNFTIKSEAYSSEIKKISEDVKVYGVACPSFVPFIEKEDYVDYDKTFNILDYELKDTKELTADTLILGCTHYPIIQKNIEQYYNDNINVISSAIETTREVSELLEKNNMLNNELSANHKFFISEHSDEFKNTAHKWLGINIDLEIV